MPDSILVWTPGDVIGIALIAVVVVAYGVAYVADRLKR